MGRLCPFYLNLNNLNIKKLKIMVGFRQSPTRPDLKQVGHFISVTGSSSGWVIPHPPRPIATLKSTLIIGVCDNFIDIRTYIHTYVCMYVCTFLIVYLNI